MYRAVICAGVMALVLLGGALPVSAQFRPPASANPTVGERYHVEAAYTFWGADPDLIISSESLGIPGDDVDLVNDLGIEEKRLRELRLVLRPATKHKFRINYTPDQIRGGNRPAARVHLQRPALPHRPAGQHRGGFDDLALRL